LLFRELAIDRLNAYPTHPRPDGATAGITVEFESAEAGEVSINRNSGAVFQSLPLHYR
jgi:hypothetical protein